MRNIRKRIFAYLVFTFSFSFLTMPLVSFSQESQYTPYEKKVVDIHTKYFAKIYYHKNVSQLNGEETMALSLMVGGTSFSELPTLIYIGLVDLYMKNPSAAEQLSNSYEKEMKAAEKLKNKTDLERERKRALTGTEMGKTLNKLREKIEEWTNKKEFEKESDWLNRLQTQSENLYINDVNRTISEIVDAKEINVSLGEYDSEKEQFPIKINCIDNDNKNAVTTMVTIPIEHAPVFKEYFYTSSTKISFSHTPSNLVQVNNLFLPKKMQLEYRIENRTYSVEIPYCERNNINDNYAIEDIVIHFNDIGVNNPYLNGSSYNFTKQTITHNSEMVKFKSEQEKQRQKEAEELKIKQINDSVFLSVSNSIHSAVSEYNTLLSQYPYDFQSNKLSILLPDNMWGENQRLSDTLKVLTEYVYNKKTVLQQKFHADSTTFSKSKDTLQQAVQIVNEQLFKYPYNINRQSITDSLEISYFGNNELLHKVLTEKIESLPVRQKEMENRIYDKLQKENPSRFVNIYFSENPKSKFQADSQYVECRCKYKDILYFQLDYINNTVPTCDCREKSFIEVGYLFKNRTEFDQFYSTKELEFNKEIYKRKELREDLHAFEKELINSKPLNLKKALLSDKPEIKSIVDRLNYHKSQCYYDDAVALLFKFNPGLSKEWEKNGKLFSCQAEMYEAYISEDYAKILKSKKKDS